MFVCLYRLIPVCRQTYTSHQGRVHHRGVMRARCHPWKMPKHSFHKMKPQVIPSCTWLSTYIPGYHSFHKMNPQVIPSYTWLSTYIAGYPGIYLSDDTARPIGPCDLMLGRAPLFPLFRALKCNTTPTMPHNLRHLKGSAFQFGTATQPPRMAVGGATCTRSIRGCGRLGAGGLALEVWICHGLSVVSVPAGFDSAGRIGWQLSVKRTRYKTEGKENP